MRRAGNGPRQWPHARKLPNRIRLDLLQGISARLTHSPKGSITSYLLDSIGNTSYLLDSREYGAGMYLILCLSNEDIKHLSDKVILSEGTWKNGRANGA